MLAVEDLSVSYGPVQALRGVSVEVGGNEFVSIIGPNGAGKTTLLKAICTAVPWTGGDVRVDGRSLRGLSPWDVARLGIAHVPEGRRVFGQMTVEENLKVSAMRRRVDPKRLAGVFEVFPRLHDLRHRRAITMSGGEQQMLAIGRALMSEPRLLMLDEPSMGLAPLLVEQVFGHIVALFRAGGLSVLLIEQRVTEALEASQRSYVLEQGRVVMNGDAGAMLNSEDIQRAYLGLSAAP
jgi:branched-chain amino acid transport system ATP-binding protein